VSVSVKLEGFSDLDKALQELPKGVQKPTLRRALKEAAEPMAEKARNLAPVDPESPGDLAGSIAVSTKLSKRQAKLHRKMFRDDKAAVEMFLGAGPDPAAWNQEFGNVNHGPQAFMRPAWQTEQRPILDRLKSSLWEQIEKSAARAARKAARAMR
jgi:HK97 gp10 family phage protein